MNKRIVFEWKCGAWINSNHNEFVKDLIGLIEQYGPPDLVEVRKEGEKEIIVEIPRTEPQEFKLDLLDLRNVKVEKQD